MVCFFVEDAPAKNKDTRYQWQKQDSALLPLLFVYFAYLFFLFNTSFFVIKATDAEYDIAFIPLFFIVLTLTQTLTSYYFGLRIDKSGVPGMLLFSFLCGVLTQISLYFGMMWLCFVLLGLFTVSSMNAIRVYISQRAINKSTVFGVLYGGTALCSSLGVLLTGYIWSNYSDSLSILVSIIGTSTVLILMFFTRSKLIPVPVP